MIAEVARETLSLDVVEFIPARQPPHKLCIRHTPARDRLALVQTAIESFTSFQVSQVEILRDGPSYTFNTVSYFRETFPNDELWWLVGADMLNDFPNWHRADELSQMITLVAAPRPHFDLQLEARQFCERFPGANVVCLDMPELDIASTWIRERLRKGLRIDPLLPRDVYEQIVSEGLYLD